MRVKAFSSIAIVATLTACSQSAVTPTGGQASPAYGNPALHNYKVSIFVRGTDKRHNPDPIVWENGFLFVAYQNATGPTGTGGDSTIVQYDRKGRVVKSIKVPGRCDGMRWNP